MKKILFCALFGVCTFVCVNVRAKTVEFKNYSGKVVDSKTNEPLSGVNIVIANGDGACSVRPDTYCGCSTDLDGMFGNDGNLCNLSSNVVDLSHVAYEAKTNITLAVSDNNIELDSKAYVLNSVTIDSTAIDNVMTESVVLTDEDKCNKLGDDVAKWENDTCKCVQENYIFQNGKCIEDPNVLEQRVQEARDAYNDAKENEQSTENKTMTALTTAATGIGLMEAFQGRAEQTADAAAESDMAAYIETMRCSYGDGKSVKASLEPIELPAGDGETMTALRSEYMSLARSLKERKESLGMAPGIESEEILDKADMGLYDDENTGITGGSYASLYRAQMMGSEKDQSKIDKDADKSDKRLKIGATVAGVGIVGGVVANSVINGKLGEQLKTAVDNGSVGTETRALLRTEATANGKLGEQLKTAVDNGSVGTETRALLHTEATALNNLRQCLKTAGVTDTDNLSFTNFYPSVLSVYRIDCGFELASLNGKSAIGMFADSTDAIYIYNTLTSTGFDDSMIAKMVGARKADSGSIINKLGNSIADIQQKFRDAEARDKSYASESGI